MTTTLDRPRTSYGGQQYQSQTFTPEQLDRESKDIVTQEILPSVDSKVEYHIWNALKKIQAEDMRANYIVDMVRSGVPLHKFIQIDALKHFAAPEATLQSGGNGR